MAAADSAYISFYIIAGISFVCSVLVMTTLFLARRTAKNCFTFLLLWLHASMIAQEVTLLPSVYDRNHGVCTMMEFLHYYFGSMNIIIITLLIEAHRSTLLTGSFQSRKLILKYGAALFVGFPLITVLPGHVSKNEC